MGILVGTRKILRALASTARVMASEFDGREYLCDRSVAELMREMRVMLMLMLMLRMHSGSPVAHRLNDARWRRKE